MVTNMNKNQRFAISVHALTLLASSEEPLTSEAIAGSVDTNPVVIRRTMASLREHGLVGSKSGAHGGWHLLRKPKQIALCDIYRSLGEEDVLGHTQPPQVNIVPLAEKSQVALQERISMRRRQKWKNR